MAEVRLRLRELRARRRRATQERHHEDRMSREEADQLSPGEPGGTEHGGVDLAHAA